MSVARTYFLNRMHDDELVSVLGQRQDFFLENIDTLNDATQRIQSLLARDGLSSTVELTPINGPASFTETLLPMIPVIGWLWVMARGSALLARPRSDVTLRATSNTSLSVAFSRSATRATA